jgi:hypothetical protein
MTPLLTRISAIKRRESDEKNRAQRDAERLRAEQARRGGLIEFVRYFWHVLEPSTRELVEEWPLEALCDHLEAITFKEIKRLLINVPPGFMKSLLVNVFWPAWEWGPMNMPFLRHLAFSYAERLTTRDNNKLVRLVMSPGYRTLWGNRFEMLKIGEKRPENDRTGYVLATSITGIGTGERGDRIRLDDPHNVVDIESYEVRQKTVMFFRESMSNRHAPAAVAPQGPTAADPGCSTAKKRSHFATSFLGVRLHHASSRGALSRISPLNLS